MSNSEDDKQNLPLFHLSEKFPDAQSIFTTSVPSLEEFKDEALIVLDTNVLLIPYEIQPKSLDEIKNTYNQLIKESRLFIPSQVAREFAKNRGEKIKNLHHNISLKQNVSVKIESYQLLESDAEYQELLNAEKELNQKIFEYRKIVGKVLERIRSWRWNDPVSNLYRELFPSEIVIDLKTAPDEIEKDLNRRFNNRIAPGFKDASKKDRGIGDVIIWNTILQLGKEHKKPIIFVSGDEKTDWMLRSNNEALYPNFELIEEYMRVSDGKAFHILKFSELLDLFGAKADVVEEVKKEELFTVVRHAGFVERFEREQFYLKTVIAVTVWLQNNFKAKEIYDLGRSFIDLVVELENDEKIGVVIKASTSFKSIKNNFRHWKNEIQIQQNKRELNKCVLFIVSGDIKIAEDFFEWLLHNYNDDNDDDFRLIIGFLNAYDEFESMYDSIQKS